MAFSWQRLTLWCDVIQSNFAFRVCMDLHLHGLHVLAMNFLWPISFLLRRQFRTSPRSPTQFWPDGERVETLSSLWILFSFLMILFVTGVGFTRLSLSTGRDGPSWRVGWHRSHASVKYQWRGLRPSVLGQDRSETKENRSWSWSCTLRSWSCSSGVVLWNTILSRSSS